MLSISSLTMEFGGNPLLDSISFLINPKDKIAIVGRNGAGKTTLLKLIAGVIEPSAGVVSKPKDFSVGYLPQHILTQDIRSVKEETLMAFETVFEKKKQVEELTNRLATAPNLTDKEYGSICEKIEDANHILQMFGIENIEAETEKTLIGLGFSRSDFDRQTSEFSGGWRMRIELAKIILQKPDLILLDEPTNHLDIESINWLESFLKNTNSAVVIVSHDKAFLDSIVDRTVEISLGKIYSFNANYSKYLEIRQLNKEQLTREYENQQKLIADTEAFIEKFRYKASKAVQVQSRIKHLEKLKRIELEEENNTRLNIKFPMATPSGILPINIENLTKIYGNQCVLNNIDMQINRGEKVAFVGKNGEGKTSLIRCIMGETDYLGSINLGHNVKIGYFAQNQTSTLDESRTVFQTIDDVAVGEIRTKIRALLGSFMFRGDDIDKKVSVLSGGEKSRLAMIKLLLQPVNFLILDEPTNHLDIPAKEILKQAIANFAGSVVIVSHDRDFLDGLTELIYEFSNKKIRQYGGGIEGFLKEKKFNSIREFEQSAPKKNAEENKTVKKENKLQYEQQKEHAKRERKREKQIEQTEQEIADIERQIAEIESKFASGDSSKELSIEFAKMQHLLNQKMYEWELLCF